MNGKSDDGLIGFFGVYPTLDRQGYLGALLVLDRLGKPEEFRVTYPIKPDTLQRLTYGASLEQHIGVELCGRPLIASLVSRPRLRAVIVANADLVDLSDGLVYPLVVTGLGEAKPRLTAEQLDEVFEDILSPEMGYPDYFDYWDMIPPEVWEEIKSALLKRLLQELENDASKDNGAAAARVHHPLQDVPQLHFPPAYSESDRQACISLVEDLAQADGLTEPFERMRTAVGVLADEDERFR